MDWVKRLGNSERMKMLRRLITETSGVDIVEAALVMPIMFMILLGIFWFGRSYNIYATVSYAAHEGARIAARPTCASTCTNDFPPTTEVVTKVEDVLHAANLTTTASPQRVITYDIAPNYCPGFTQANSCQTLRNITVCRNVRMNAVASNIPICGALVSFRYRVQINIPNLWSFRGFDLPGVAEFPMEN